MQKIVFNSNGQTAGTVITHEGKEHNDVLQISAEVGGNCEITSYVPLKTIFHNVKEIRLDESERYIIEFNNGSKTYFSPKN
jgi:hypothetical protein